MNEIVAKPTAFEALAPTLVLGINIGASGIHACAMDGDERVAETRNRSISASERRDPMAWARSLDALLRGMTVLNRVVRVAVSGPSGTVMGLDARGAPVGPPAMHDALADDPALTARLDRLAPSDAVAGGPASPVAKALHVLARDGVASVCHQADWIGGLLTGRFNLTDENNALKTGYDPVAARWPDWLVEAGLDLSALPAVRPVGAPLAPLSAGVVSRYGFPRSAVLHAGTTEGCAAVLATGATAPGDGITSLGVRLVLELLSDKPVIDRATGVHSYRLGNLWLVRGASNTGMAVVHRYFSTRELAELWPKLDVTHEVAGGPYYPLLEPGERFPVTDPGYAPVLPDPSDGVEFLHALLTGMADIEARGYQRLAALGAPTLDRVFTLGDGIDHAAWTALRARKVRAAMPAPAPRHPAFGTARVALGRVLNRQTVR